MNNASVQSQLERQFSNVTDGQFSEIYQAAARGVLPFINRLRQVGGAQRFATGTIVADAVSVALISLLPKRVKMSSEEVEWWQKYYRDNFKISTEFGDLLVPAPMEYPTRLFVMHEAIADKCNPIAAVYKKRCADKGFGWGQFTNDLDGAMRIENPHAQSGTYGIRVRDVRDAEFGNVDGENLSSRQIWDRGVLATTLPERLIDGDTHLLKKDEHLDQNVINVCPGSVLASGRVPGVNFDLGDRKVYVGLWHPYNALDFLRFRPAIC